MLEVTFYKEVHHLFGKPTMEEVKFIHESDNMNEAYEKALELGHNPFKLIRWRHLPTNS